MLASVWNSFGLQLQSHVDNVTIIGLKQNACNSLKLFWTALKFRFDNATADRARVKRSQRWPRSSTGQEASELLLDPFSAEDSLAVVRDFFVFKFWGYSVKEEARDRFDREKNKLTSGNWDSVFYMLVASDAAALLLLTRIFIRSTLILIMLGWPCENIRFCESFCCFFVSSSYFPVCVFDIFISSCQFPNCQLYISGRCARFSGNDSVTLLVLVQF